MISPHLTLETYHFTIHSPLRGKNDRDVRKLFSSYCAKVIVTRVWICSTYPDAECYSCVCLDSGQNG